MKHSIWIFTLLGFIIFVSAPGNAEEGGGGHYTPAVAATLIELLPTEPGFILQPIYLHFSGDAGLSRTFPIAGRITSDLDAEVNSITLGALYTFDKRVFGSRYTVGIYAPYIWQ